jgi:hypothetical protein
MHRYELTPSRLRNTYSAFVRIISAAAFAGVSWDGKSGGGSVRNSSENILKIIE